MNTLGLLGSISENVIKKYGDGTSKYLGLETGYYELDEKTEGIHGLTILAGAPKTGKSTLALQIAYNLSLRNTPVIYYSLEMNPSEIWARVFSILSYENDIGNFTTSEIMKKGKAYNNESHSEYEDFSKLGQIITDNKYFYLRTQEANNNTLKEDIKKVINDYPDQKIVIFIDMLNHFNLVDDKGKGKQFHTDLERDKEVMGELSSIYTDEKYKENILPFVIMQINKQGQKSEEMDLTQIMGSAISTYTATNIWGLKDSKIYFKSRYTKGGSMDLKQHENTQYIKLSRDKNNPYELGRI